MKRRIIYKTEEVKIYKRAERGKYDGEKRLREVGFPDKPLNEAYAEEVSQYAW